MSNEPKSPEVREFLDRLGDPVFEEAVEVLQSIANNPREREIYDAHLKMRRDEQSRIAAAEERGEALGEAKGRVRLLCEFLDQSAQEPDGLSIDELAAMERELRNQFQQRGQSS